jgi:hypothetical protein
MDKLSYGLFDAGPTLYQFEVTLPDGESMAIEMRALAQDELWALERDLPPMPDAPYTGDFKKDEKGNVEPLRNFADPGYVRAREQWIVDRMNALILACWTEIIPGDTRLEQVRAIGRMPAWAVSALWKCAQLVTRVEDDAIRAYPFQRDGVGGAATLRAQGLDAGPLPGLAEPGALAVAGAPVEAGTDDPALA